MIHQNLVIRSDSSVQIGTGHIMRCLSLAQAWKDQGGEIIFVIAGKPSTIEARLQSEGMKVLHLSVDASSNEDAQQTANIAQQLGASWIVVDGYHLGREYQKALKSHGVGLLFVDDYGHAEHYYADLVLNQNISASENLYTNRESYTQLLLGTKYTLLRREFWKWQSLPKEITLIAHKILVTLGGSDPDNVTLKVVQALQQVNIDCLDVIVVVGGSNPHYAVLQAEIALSRKLISSQQNVNSMPELMAWADIAIAAGGSTNWELAFMGLPSIVITVADNQKVIADELAVQGIIINLGWHQDLTIEQIGLVLQGLIGDRPKRQIMSKKARELVDGIGSQRVIDAIINAKHSNT